ncbi:MAG TPA: hypothetical protein VGF79_13830 [Bacteroidia bacterium]
MILYNTPKNLIILLLNLTAFSSMAQDSEGKFIKDAKTGCTVWFKHYFEEDSITWTGNCKDGFAEGKGTMTGFTKGKQSAKYIGEMHQGKPYGKGVFTFWGDRKLEGNFSNGEPLFLNQDLLKQLHRNIISNKDTSNTYDGDNNAKNLFYDILLPKEKINGVVILMPGTWETTEHLLSSMNTFCELAHKNNLAVMALSINQRLTLNEAIVSLMNSMIQDAITKYNLPKTKFVMGGWSMGGLFSLRYSELAHQDSTKTAIVPRAVFSCDGPCDLENLYNNFQRKLNKNPGQGEPAYGIAEMEKYCNGTPQTALDMYNYYSCFTYNSKVGGNAQYLLNIPVRIYGDVDPIWWMQNRHLDMYDLNALDQTAMIQLLNDMGNPKAEFINAYQKGYRLEGNRHPHSWSIIEPVDCINWILEALK